MFLCPKSYDNTIRFAITNSGNGAEQRIDTSAPLATNTWVYVTVTLGGSGASIYLNGVQAATSTAVNITPQSFSPTLNYIGKAQFPGPLFTGRIDDFRMYNYALSATEVSALMAQTLPTLAPALAEAVSVYPNPAAGQAELVLPAALSRTTTTAELLDATGRVAATHTLATGSTSHALPLSSLAPGVYSLRLHTPDGIATKKLVGN